MPTEQKKKHKNKNRATYDISTQQQNEYLFLYYTVQ